MAITSQVRQPLAFCEALVGDWQAAGLIKQSVLKPVLTTIEQHLVIRTMGRLNAADDKTLREVIGDVIG
jgi:mRNA interferase MazF